MRYEGKKVIFKEVPFRSGIRAKEEGVEY